MKMEILACFLLFTWINGILSSEEVVEKLLPDHVLPEHYKLDFMIDPNNNESFRGVVDIIVRVEVDTTDIVLHGSDNLNLHSVSVKHIDEEIAEYLDVKPGYVSIHLNQTMKTGEEYVIVFKYDATFGDRSGFFIRSNINEAGSSENLVTSQFEDKYARKAFPCFDEPRFKANFSIILRHPVEYKAISNMDVKQSIPVPENDSWVMTSFNPTPKMSTYLVAILISKLKGVNNFENDLIHNKLIEIYSYNNSEYQNKLTIKAAEKYLKDMEDYLDFKYDLPKLTIAFITDFPSLGMENWGLIIFDDKVQNRLNYGKYSEILYLQQIRHEIAHMWFGNEATLIDWNSLWINEGFAYYFQYKHSDFMVENYGDDTLAMYVQSSLNAEYYNKFNLSSCIGDVTLRTNAYWYYVKSACIIRMIERTIGEPCFQQSMKNYIRKYSRRSVSPKNVSDEFQIASNYSLPDGMFESWITNDGFPLVHAYQRPNSRIVDIYQTTVNRSGIMDNGKWYIPLNWATKSRPDFTNTTVQMWLKPYENISITLDDENDWFILNVQQTGYYRVAYDDGNWKKISQALQAENFSGIDPITRLQLINDVFLPTKYDTKAYPNVLEILKYIKNEYHYLPWTNLKDHLEIIPSVTKLIKNLDLLKIFIQNSIKDQLKVFSESSDYRYEAAKDVVLRLGCKYEAEYAVNHYYKKIEEALINDSIDINYYTVYCGLSKADQNVWNSVMQMFLRNDHCLELSSVFALLSTHNEIILKRFYMMLIDDNFSKNYEDKLSLIKSMSALHHPHPELLMDFVIANFDKLNGIYDKKVMKEFLGCLKGQRITEEYQGKVKIFYDKYYNVENDFRDILDEILIETVVNLEMQKTVTQNLDLWLVKNVEKSN